MLKKKIKKKSPASRNSETNCAEVEDKREEDGWRQSEAERGAAPCGSTEPYGRPLSEMQMTAVLLLRFPKQILTPAGAGTLSDSDTRLPSSASFLPPPPLPLSLLLTRCRPGEEERGGGGA